MDTHKRVLTNAELAEACFSDLLPPSIWGYGLKRIYIGVDIENSFPNNYSGFGYKNEQGILMIGLHWNKYTHYPPKFVSYNKDDNIMKKWNTLIEEFKKEKNSNIISK